MGQIMTVTGPIAPEKLGITMSHLHLLIANLAFWQEPQELSRRVYANAPVSMSILGRLRRQGSANRDNLIKDSIDEAIEELNNFRMAGGNSIVECSVEGLGRDPVGLAKISRMTGINVITSAGYYIAASHQPYIKTRTVEQLCDQMVHDLTIGFGTTGIKAGNIKIAVSGIEPGVPFYGNLSEKAFSKDEEKILRAAARASAKTGAPLGVHPNMFGKHSEAYLNVIKEEGADVKKFVCFHMEMYLPDVEYIKSILKSGCWVSFDQFGEEFYSDGVYPGWHWPFDSERIDGLVALIKAGFINQLVISNECVFKCDMRKYGGYGMAHFLENIVPVLKYRGVTDEQLHTILVENPRKVLTF